MDSSGNYSFSNVALHLGMLKLNRWVLWEDNTENIRVWLHVEYCLYLSDRGRSRTSAVVNNWVGI